ncbi:putative glutathione S-transferase DHAR1, cytosolic [Frankliniella fusca]|uniref:Glutathione S-transferase DHAR1, cytosolic n=1 Tax=Frankliniella fusca TaxID=407009 RepID=A0AAE1H2P4_9NEOP|nr:putative glutathione S-transferase DHAR1, cytosolic [Frankliniella fusca]
MGQLTRASAFLLAVALAVAVTSATASSSRSYRGYRVLSAVPEHGDLAAELRSMSTWTGVDMWSRRAAPGSPVTLMVAPAAQRRVLQRLEELRVPYTLSEHDAQR